MRHFEAENHRKNKEQELMNNSVFSNKSWVSNIPYNTIRRRKKLSV